MNRTKSVVSAVVVIVVYVASLFGVSLDEGPVTTAVSVTAALAALTWGVWKNHNFTDAANQAQKVLDDLKSKED